MSDDDILLPVLYAMLALVGVFTIAMFSLIGVRTVPVVAARINPDSQAQVLSSAQEEDAPEGESISFLSKITGFFSKEDAPEDEIAGTLPEPTADETAPSDPVAEPTPELVAETDPEPAAEPETEEAATPEAQPEPKPEPDTEPAAEPQPVTSPEPSPAAPVAANTQGTAKNEGAGAAVSSQPTENGPKTIKGNYVGSKESNKYHYPSCRHAEKILVENEIWWNTIEEAIAVGYDSCGVCHPM